MPVVLPPIGKGHFYTTLKRNLPLLEIGFLTGGLKGHLFLVGKLPKR
jgi:hypothetical protein